MNYKRILFKLSGEVLMGPDEYGINLATIKSIAEEIKEVVRLGIEVCVVIGGGNIFRGMSAAADGMNRTTADHIGMLATVMNALALQNALESIEVPSRVLSALQINSVCEPYIRLRAIRHLEKGRVVIFGAGTGNPYFTTDTAAALRASEMSCDALFKGTKVDGVYDSDPKTNPDAKRFDNITYLDVLSKDLQVMDAAAISVSRENNVPVVVFSLEEKGNFVSVVKGEGKFTLVKD